MSDLAQRKTSKRCQWPVEMVRRLGWNGRLCDRQRKYKLPYFLMAEMFSNEIVMPIFCASTFEIYPI